MSDHRIIRILLLEDNPDDLFLLRAALSKVQTHHFALFQADRLKDAVELLREQPVDVVLADLHLPDSAGLDTVKNLVRNSDSVPIIVLTGYDDEALGATALTEGAFGFLSKDDFNSPRLPQAIDRAVSSKQHPRSQSK